MPRTVNGVQHYSLAEYKRMMQEQEAGEKQTRNAFDCAKAAPHPEAVKPNNKYHAKKTVVDEITFDSKLEAEWYKLLKLMKHAGEIRWFNLQPSFVLPGRIRYRPDFIVCDNSGNIWVEDAKGKETKDFIIKKKQFRECYPGLELRIINQV